MLSFSLSLKEQDPLYLVALDSEVPEIRAWPDLSSFMLQHLSRRPALRRYSVLFCIIDETFMLICTVFNVSCYLGLATDTSENLSSTDTCLQTSERT